MTLTPNCKHGKERECGFCMVIKESLLIRKDLLLD